MSNAYANSALVKFSDKHGQKLGDSRRTLSQFSRVSASHRFVFFVTYPLLFRIRPNSPASTVAFLVERFLSALKEVPVIAISGYASDEDRTRALDVGSNSQPRIGSGASTI